MIFGKTKFYKIWKNKLSTRFKRRRFRKIMQAINVSGKLKILDVGCSYGHDALQFLNDGEKYSCWGVDIKPRIIDQDNVTFMQANARELPFEDKFFDIVITIGLLEHIEPIEDLAQVISELDRVGKHQLSVVPSVTTLIEPHTGKWRLPLRLHNRSSVRLNFLSEFTWTKFKGFGNCKVKRFYYIFPWMKNTLIYR